MKKKYVYMVGFLAFILVSCNTYRWQRKHYYQKDPKKNWNYIKKDSASKR